jgi:hypothetical protein
MSMPGTYFIKKWIPEPGPVHGVGFPNFAYGRKIG